MIGYVLVTVAACATVYAAALASKAHLDPRTRNEVAFVLTLTAAAVGFGGAILVATIGRIQ